MITLETAATISECYREIAEAEKILADIDAQRQAAAERDFYGLLESTIRAHIADKQALLVAANEQARIELAP